MQRRLVSGVVLAGFIACKPGTSPRPTVPANVLDGTPTRTAPATLYTGDEGDGTTTVKPLSAPSSPDGLTPEAACARFEALATSRCDWTARFPPEFRQGNTCVTSLNNWFSPATDDHESLQAMVGCWTQSCDEAANCMAELKRNAPAPKPRTCGQEGTAPILVAATEYANRKGATTKRFSDLATTEASPVEVCGVQGEVDWMVRVTCNDGSNPYHSVETANASRDSYLKTGGRCQSVLDRFTVKCPEATYPIYVDRYICPQP